ncbi:poly rna polymerase [Stylonychia lemnae]|uniref:Poly rna polymerase n=1 Tax=Stylonychia lemnae TaxID=5949 RepID=A0A078B737_STYLE|nr:poly rna polymerase [Stylonychia lemnae]|eukprot:CDW89117.1 poly rna polymerase [Stylonychia lemnae]
MDKIFKQLIDQRNTQTPQDILQSLSQESTYSSLEPLDELICFQTQESVETRRERLLKESQCKGKLNSKQYIIASLSLDQINQLIKQNLQKIPPWVNEQTLSIKTKSARAYFHSEVLRFVEWIQMSDAEIKQRYEILNEIEKLVQIKIPGTQLYMFGSTANRLAFSGSDIDILVMNNDYGYANLYNHVLHIMVESNLFESIDDIRNTQVPIIQAQHKATGISMDIVMNRDDGLKGLSLVSTLISKYPELRPMYFVLKAFLKYKNVHKPYTGGIGSFVLINMIAFYLQMHYKRVRDINEKVFLQDHIICFFKFFGRQLDIKFLGFSIRDGGFIFDKDHEYLGKEGNTREDFKLCIESPLQFSDDLGGSVRNISIIRKLFNLASDVIRYNLLNSNSFVLLIVPEAYKLKNLDQD